MTKKELREHYGSKRDALTSDARDRLSRELCEKFFSHFDLSTVRILHCYLPLERKHEINTWFIISSITEKFPSIRVVVPHVTGSTELESIHYTGRDNLQLNALGIQEPVAGEPVDPGSIDLVIVPLIAFDKQGHRVGYGKGFYDRFLVKCNASCRKVGLSFFDAVDRIDDVSAMDTRLTHALSPTQYYNFK